jgi:hypothetical protein
MGGSGSTGAPPCDWRWTHLPPPNTHTGPQFGLYSYYIALAWVLRTLSPPLAQMAATEAGLSGSYRAAHQRLVAAAEEVAFNDPPAGGRLRTQAGCGLEEAHCRRAAFRFSTAACRAPVTCRAQHGTQ